MARLKEAKYYKPNYRALVKEYGSESAVRAEYRRLYDIIHKRVVRASQAGFGDRLVTGEMRKITKISEVGSNSELARQLSKAYRQLTKESYTLKGQRESGQKALQTMIKHGQVLPGAKKEDLDAVFQRARKSGFLKVYGSAKTQSLYKERQKRGKESYKDWKWTMVMDQARHVRGSAEV